MAAVLIRPIWVAATQRFHDVVTRRILPTKLAARYLRSESGSFKDYWHRFVPKHVLGGIVTRQWPTGAANIAAVTRRIEGDPTTILYRSNDMAVATVTYIHPELGRQETTVWMRKGVEYNEDEFRERLARRLVKIRAEDTPELTEMPEILEDEITWEITTVYEEGEYLGGDVARFEG